MRECLLAVTVHCSSSNRRSSAGGLVENFTQALDLRREIMGVIADEKAAIVRDVGIADFPRAVVVEVADHVVPQEVAAGDDAIADIRLLQRRHDLGAVDAKARVEDDREAEPRAAAVFALDDETLVA